MKRRSGRPRAVEECLYGLHPIREALAAGRRPLVRLRVRRGSRRPDLDGLVAQARARGVPVEEVGEGALRTGLPADANAQGAVLEAGPLPETSLEDLLDGAPSEPRTLLALDGVEDPQNAGAIARVAEAAGARALVLTRRRAPPLSPALARASAGAIEWLPVARVPNLPRALKYLKSRDFWVFGASPVDGLDLFELPDRVLRGSRVLVLGAEGRGLRPGVERELDHRVRIPLAGRVASLNVSAAAAVLLFELRRRSTVAGRG